MTILIPEAVKMKDEYQSYAKGILKDIFVKENYPVEKGIMLFSIE